jgi:hypothetical protein
VYILNAKKVFISFLIITSFLIPHKVQAFQIKDYQSVPSNKPWTIRFTGNVSFDNLTQSGITVTSSKGKKVNISLSKGIDSKSIFVTPPSGGYPEGETYTLTVDVKAHSIKGKNLKQNRAINFNVPYTDHSQLTEQEKVQDFEYMYKIMSENYPYFKVNQRLNGIDWLSNKNKYEALIKATDSDDSFFNTMNNILKDLHNGHVHMVSNDFYLLMKKNYELSKSENRAWLNQLNDPKALKRYSATNNLFAASPNVKTEFLKEGQVAYLSIKSFLLSNVEGDMETIRPFLENSKDCKALIIDIRGNGGGAVSYWANNIIPMLINTPKYNIEYSAYRGGKFTEQFLRNGYKTLSPIENIYNHNLKDLPPELKEDFKYYSQSVRSIIPKNPVEFHGKTYLLVDNGVFSAAEAFAAFSKDTGFATLIGEKTGGDGIGGDPAVCVLPNSGYIFRFSKQMGLTSDGTCNFECKTEPDINVSATKGSDLSNDEAVETVLNLLN